MMTAHLWVAGDGYANGSKSYQAGRRAANSAAGSFSPNKSPDKFRRDLRHDRVADAAEQRGAAHVFAGATISQSEGQPINQALKAGFNTPSFFVGTRDEFEVAPWA